ncbi:unnamed protein product [Phytophthora lilii]|uniref:Unnamed protein product n=1 Tax=Phytophthora lilii TaxID=2077276 RepID=A0A9W6TPZ9_9STRA|nr:unnamed protein product [Phytophthora lilii]
MNRELKSPPKHVQCTGSTIIGTVPEPWYGIAFVLNRNLPDRYLKERDVQLDQLRRQLKFAVTEEEETLKELKTITNEHSAEKLELEKKVVELEAQLELVEGKLNEWKEKALESASQLRTQTRQFAMKVRLANENCAWTVSNFSLFFLCLYARQIQLLKDELEAAQDSSSTSSQVCTRLSLFPVRCIFIGYDFPQSEDTILESQIRLLKSQLKEKTMEAEHAASSLQGAQETLENAREVRELNEQIMQLQSTERKLKAENRPAAAVIELYKARQNAFEILYEHKSNVEIQRRRLEKQCEKLQNDLITSGNNCAKLEMQLAEIQEKMSGANDVVTHLRKVNAELVEILETYGKDLDDHEANELSAKRVTLLESSLKQSQELIKGMEFTQKTMATPAAVKKYEARIERLEKALADAKQENGNLTKHIERTEMELAIFEKRLGRGDFNVETTKIVHLAVNPTRELLQSKAKSSDIEKLRQENEALRARLSKLTDGEDTEVRLIILLRGFC